MKPNSKQLKYSLIIDFVNNRMCFDQFCNMFATVGVYCDDNNFDDAFPEEELTPDEEKLFSELDEITGRYADKECRKELPGLYYSESDVLSKVLECCEKLEIPMPS
ncbi:MAG: hypothetical protein ACRC2T_11380 [Thermoguttaceae bacterium]